MKCQYRDYVEKGKKNKKSGNEDRNPKRSKQTKTKWK